MPLQNTIASFLLAWKRIIPAAVGRDSHLSRCETVYPACRSRMHLLFACLVKLNARLRTGRKGPLGHARQLALARAMHDFSEVARNALPSDTDSFLTLPDPMDSQFWVSALSGLALCFCLL